MSQDPLKTCGCIEALLLPNSLNGPGGSFTTRLHYDTAAWKCWCLKSFVIILNLEGQKNVISKGAEVTKETNSKRHKCF